MKRTISVTSKSAFFILVLSLIAWASGAPFIFPSLGPTAYILAFDQKISYSARVVIGGHTCGILGGLVSYHLVVDPYNMLMLTETISSPGIFLGSGAVLAIAITAFLMILFQVSHPPACATTLIISLGILPTWMNSLIIIAAVILLYITYWIFQKLEQSFGNIDNT